MSLFNKIKSLIHDDASKPNGAQRVSAFSPEALDSPPQYTFIDALHAAKQGNFEKIQDYLNFNTRYAQCRSWDEKTLLHEAVSAGRLAIVKLLLERGARVDALYKGITPLLFAIESDGHHLGSVTPQQQVEFKKNRVEIIRLLIQEHADLNYPNQNNELPIHLAAKLGQSELVELFLTHGSSVDIPIQNNNGKGSNAGSRTPLLLATRYLKDQRTVQILLENGANPNYRDTYPGYSALHYVTAYHLPETDTKQFDLAHVTQLLLDHHADIHLPTADKDKYQPIHLAILRHHFDVLKVLVTGGADVYALDALNRMPLGLAAYLGDIKMIEYLLDIGVDAYRSKAAFYAAACVDSDQPLHVLQRRGIDINRPAPNGHTPLFEAVTAHSVANFKFLLENGGDTKIHAPGLSLSEHAFACWGTVACLRGEDVSEERRQHALAARQIVELLDGFKIEKPKYYF